MIRRKNRWGVAILVSTLLTACSNLSLKLATPFNTVSDDELQDMYLVVVTFTQYKEDKLSRDRFNELTEDIVDHIRTAEGLYGYSVRKDFLGNTAWTYTIWESNQAMNNFKVSDYHLEAMKSAGNVLEQAKFAKTFISAKALNYSWQQALALLESDARSYTFTGSDISEAQSYIGKY